MHWIFISIMTMNYIFKMLTFRRDQWVKVSHKLPQCGSEYYLITIDTVYAGPKAIACRPCVEWQISIIVSHIWGLLLLYNDTIVWWQVNVPSHDAYCEIMLVEKLNKVLEECSQLYWPYEETSWCLCSFKPSMTAKFCRSNNVLDDLMALECRTCHLWSPVVVIWEQFQLECLRIIKLSHHWFGKWHIACLAPNFYQNQSWLIVNLTAGNKFQWNLNQNASISIKSGSHFCLHISVCPHGLPSWSCCGSVVHFWASIWYFLVTFIINNCIEYPHMISATVLLHKHMNTIAIHCGQCPFYVQ